MTSALQKLFRKRISRQQQQHDRQKQSHDAGQSQFASTSNQRDGLKRQTISGPPVRTSSPLLQVSHIDDTDHGPPMHRTISSSSSTVAVVVTNPGEPFPYRRGGATYDGSARRGSDASASAAAGLLHRPGSYRTQSFGAASMLRDPSTESRSFRDSMLSDSHTTISVDQFGTLLSQKEGMYSQSNASSSHTHTEDEEDDLEGNTVYAALMDRLAADSPWSEAKVLLIPSKEAIRANGDQARLLSDPRFLACHVFAPSGLFKDLFDAIHLPVPQLDVNESFWSLLHVSARPDPGSHTVQVTIARSTDRDPKPKRIKRTLNVISETTVHRSASDGERPGTSQQQRKRVRLRVLIVDDVLVPSSLLNRAYASTAASTTSSVRTTTVTGRGGGDGQDDHASSVTFPTTGPTSPELSRHDSCLIPAVRQFLADYAFLLDPLPAVGPLRGPLRVTLDTLERAAADFANAYVYVPGYDAYNVSRIRRGILAKSWHAFEEARKANGDDGAGKDEADLVLWLGNEGRSRLLLLLENTVMGYCHAKVYGSICSLRYEVDEAFDAILASYHDHRVTMADLGVRSQAASAIELAQLTLECLGDPDEDMEYIMMDKNVSKIRQMAECGRLPDRVDPLKGVAPASIPRTRCRIRTPLDSLEVMHATLEQITRSLSHPQRSTARFPAQNNAPAVGADDLLPLLTYVVIRAAPRKLRSLLYYIRLFGISDATPAQHTWALVTFEAVVKYLADDPLHLCKGSEAAQMRRHVRSPTSAHSTRSSIRSPTPSIAGAATGAGRADYLEARTGGDDAQDRQRRISLPTLALFDSDSSHGYGSEHPSVKTGRSLGKAPAHRPPSVTGSIMSEDVTMLEREADGDTTVLPFKKPAMPNRALTQPHAESRSTMSRKEADALSDGGRSSSLHDSQHFHKRATSISGDLKIRPQIVVRAPHRSRDPRAVIPERPLSPQDGSNNSRGASPDPHHSVAQDVQGSGDARRRSVDSWASLSFFVGGGNNSRGEMSRQSSMTAPTAHEASHSPPLSTGTPEGLASPHHLAPLGGATGSLSSSYNSTTWLPTWASDWGLAARRPSHASASGVTLERQPSQSRPPVSRSSSSHSQEREPTRQGSLTGTPSVLLGTGSSKSMSSAMHFPSLDSMPSLEGDGPGRGGGGSGSEVEGSTMASSPRDRSSILSSPASIVSGRGLYGVAPYDQNTVKGSAWPISDAVASWSGGGVMVTAPQAGEQATETVPQARRRAGSKVRARLLSTSTPSDPLPPRLTTAEATQALPGLFAAQASLYTVTASKAGGSDGPDVASSQTNTDRGDRSFDTTATVSNKRPRPSSTVSADRFLPTPLATSSPPMLNVRSKSSDHQDVHTLRSVHGAARTAGGQPIAARRAEAVRSGIPSSTSSHSVAGATHMTMPFHSPLTHLVKLDIPSPVDERADPMSAASHAPTDVFPS